MIRDVLCSLDYSICAEISLLMFLAIFLAVSLRTLLISNSQAERHSAIPFEENQEMAGDA